MSRTSEVKNPNARIPYGLQPEKRLQGAWILGYTPSPSPRHIQQRTGRVARLSS